MKEGWSRAERDLGLDAKITRRDFLDASLLAAGSTLLRTPAPSERQPLVNPGWDGFGGVGDYARSHGNMWASIQAAHALRDGKIGGLTAANQAVDSGERYDLIVVGGGLSGLGAAGFFPEAPGRPLPGARQPSDGRGRGQTPSFWSTGFG